MNADDLVDKVKLRIGILGLGGRAAKAIEM
jgi:hypothetical protein